MGGLVLAGNTSGSTTIQATDAVTATITLPSATDTLVGKTTPSFTTTIGVGNATPSTSGAGITFPATQSASTDANTLDDYEEGTWTPAITYSGTSTATYSFRNGYYTKVGNQITLTGIISFNESTSTGNVSITGLPFTALNNTKNRSAFALFSFGWVGTTVGLMGQIQENLASIYLYLNDNAATIVTASNTDTDQDINFTCTYFGA